MSETAMKTPPIVGTGEWEDARQNLLVKEKELTRARDALAAARRIRHRRISRTKRNAVITYCGNGTVRAS